MQKHSKHYEDDATEQQRYSIWKENHAFIEQHNKNADQHGYELGMNAYGDLTTEEFNTKFNGYKMQSATNRSPDIFKSKGKELPDTMDWREKGAVTAIKNQGQCGSCWAFSTTGSLEGQHFLKTGKLVSLSEQNLLDCSGKFGDMGCLGGFMDDAFKYIIANHGIDTEASYPYLGVAQKKCNYTTENTGATMTWYKDIVESDVDALMEAVADIGPISVAMDASLQSFHFYSRGVYNDGGCSSRKLDHGVLAVGYGISNGKPYFLVKNSWGTGWGMDGYFMIQRDDNNLCGLATQASYPIL